MPAKVNCLGREGEEREREGEGEGRGAYRTPLVGTVFLLTGTTSPVPQAMLPASRGGTSEWLCVVQCGGGQQQSMADGRCVGWVGGWKEREGLPSQEDEELVVLSGKATAGDASGAGKKHVAPALPLGPFWHLVLPTPKPLENRCLKPVPRRCGLG